MEQDWRKELKDQARIDEVVEELAKTEKGNVQVHEPLRNHWLKLKIWTIEEEWKTQTSYGMNANISKPRELAETVQKEKEQQKANQQAQHVEAPKQEQIS